VLTARLALQPSSAGAECFISASADVNNVGGFRRVKLTKVLDDMEQRPTIARRPCSSPRFLRRRCLLSSAVEETRSNGLQPYHAPFHRFSQWRCSRHVALYRLDLADVGPPYSLDGPPTVFLLTNAIWQPPWCRVAHA